MQVVLGLKLGGECRCPGYGFLKVFVELFADARVAGLGGGDVGADFAVRVAERVGGEEVQDFGVGKDGGLRVEDLDWCVFRLLGWGLR